MGPGVGLSLADEQMLDVEIELCWWKVRVEADYSSGEV